MQGLVFLNSSRLRAAHAVGTQALRLGGGPKLPLQLPPPLVNGHSPLWPGHRLVCPQAPCPSTAWGPGCPRGGCKQVTGLRVEAVALRWAQVTSVDVRIWLLPGQGTRVSLEDAVSGQREGTVEP